MEEKQVVEQQVRELTEPELEKVVGGAALPERSVNDGISVDQTTEGALAAVLEATERFREMSIR